MVPAGWDLTKTSCSDNSPVGNIEVSPGETVTCTFNNLKRTTSISTKQRFTPQDTATITGSAVFNGQVDFEFYKGADCSGMLVYFERNVPLPATGTVKITNGDPATPDHDALFTIGEGEDLAQARPQTPSEARCDPSPPHQWDTRNLRKYCN